MIRVVLQVYKEFRKVAHVNSLCLVQSEWPLMFFLFVAGKEAPMTDGGIRLLSH